MIFFVEIPCVKGIHRPNFGMDITLLTTNLKVSSFWRSKSLNHEHPHITIAIVPKVKNTFWNKRVKQLQWMIDFRGFFFSKCVRINFNLCFVKVMSLTPMNNQQNPSTNNKIQHLDIKKPLFANRILPKKM
jgi:hypothetical protein